MAILNQTKCNGGENKRDLVKKMRKTHSIVWTWKNVWVFIHHDHKLSLKLILGEMFPQHVPQWTDAQNLLRVLVNSGTGEEGGGGGFIKAQTSASLMMLL